MVRSMESGSAFSFTTTRGHTTHISLLWVFVLFTFLCVAVVLLAGYQDGLKVREFGDVDVNGSLTVAEQTQLSGDVRFKTYSATIGAQANVGNAANSLGQIATGFRTGHFISSASLEIVGPLDNDAGAVTLSIGNATNTAFNQAGSTAVTGALVAATDTATPPVKVLLTGTGTNRTLTDTNNTIGARVAVAGNSAIAAGQSLIFRVTVGALDNAPDLP